MRKTVIAGIAYAITLSGCAAPTLGMKLQKSGNETILVGSVNNLLHPQKINFSATNGEMICDGTSRTAKAKSLLGKSKMTVLFDLTCNNGTTGSLAFQGTYDGGDKYYGSGSGTLDDGTKVKVVVGDAVLSAL